MGIVTMFNRDEGSKIRRDACQYLTELGHELAIVRRTREHQERGLALSGSGMLSVFISIGTVVGRLFYDAINEPEDSMLLWLIPAVFCGSLLVLPVLFHPEGEETDHPDRCRISVSRYLLQSLAFGPQSSH